MGGTKPREADTAPDTGLGRQMMGDTEPREADTAPDTRRTHLKIELSTPTVTVWEMNIGDGPRAGHHQPDWETNALLQGETDELETD